MKALAKKLKKGDTAERCGLVLKGSKIIELENISAEPEKGFEISPNNMVKYEDEMVASWHTHPDHDSNLSEKDYAGFLMWPQIKHYIVGTDGVSCYVVKDGIVINAD